MIRPALVALTAVLAAGAAEAADDASRLNGIYGVICASPETDDLSGFQIKLSTLRGQPFVELIVCEGGCTREGIVRGPGKAVNGEVQFELAEPASTNPADGFILHTGQVSKGLAQLTERYRGDSHTYLLKPLSRSRCAPGDERTFQPLAATPR